MANESARTPRSGTGLVSPQIDPIGPARLTSAPSVRPAYTRLIRAAFIVSLVISDVVAIALAFFVAYHIRTAMEQRPTRITPLTDYLPTLGFQIVVLLLTFAVMRLYLPRRITSVSDQAGSIFLAIIFGNFMALAVTALSLRGLDVPRDLLVYAWLLSMAFVWTGRTVAEQGMRLIRRAGLDPEPVLIVGTGDDGRTILRKIQSAPELGYTVIGFVDASPDPGRPSADAVAEAIALTKRVGSQRTLTLPLGGEDEPEVVGPPVLGRLEALPQLLEESGADEVIVADSTLSHADVLDIVAACDQARVNVKVFPDVFQLVVREVSVSELGGLPMLRVRDVNLRGWNLLVKRALDVVLSAALLVLLSPMMILVALGVKVTSRGPVFFIQERVGVDGRRFACVKYRSMYVDAEAKTGPVWALPGDDRTTRLGRWLRHYSIDELPQLVNVLIGDMSLVGPRPERPYFVEQFRRFIPRYEKRHQEKAGVTGWAQVNGLRGQSPIEERTLYDLFYVEHWSPAFDLKILIQTIAAVLRGRNAY